MQLFQGVFWVACLGVIHWINAPHVVEHQPLPKLDIYDPVYPILKNKAANPVFRLKITIDSIGQPGVLRSLKLDLSGTTSPLKDFTGLHIYYTGREESFSSENLFGGVKRLKDQLVIRGRQKLGPGLHYFWLSASIGDNADLDGGFKAICRHVQINGVKYPVDYPNPPKSKRLGIALRQHLDDDVHTYRIPGMVTTNFGTLMAVYDLRYNGSVDLQEDIDVGMSRSNDGGQTWAPMKVIMDLGEWGGRPEEENGIGDPSILVDRQTNTIWVAGIWAHGHPGKRNWYASRPGLEPQLTSQLMLTKSEDDGLTWSSPINLTPEVKDPNWYLLLQGPGKGISLSDGTLVFPAQYKDERQMPHATILYSKNRGRSWQLGTGAKSNTTESQVVELGDGSLMLNMRDNRGRGAEGPTGKGARAVAVTRDLGATWTTHSSSGHALPEPVCNASLIAHTFSVKGEQKRVLIFANPNDHYARKNMTVKVSFDEGHTWPDKLQLLLDEGQGRGYPSLTSIDENTIGILYEGSQADLVFQRIKIKDLIKP